MRLRVIISKSEGELQLLLSVLKRSERHGFNYLNPKQNVHHCVVVVTYDQDNLVFEPEKILLRGKLAAYDLRLGGHPSNRCYNWSINQLGN